MRSAASSSAPRAETHKYSNVSLESPMQYHTSLAEELFYQMLSSSPLDGGVDDDLVTRYGLAEELAIRSDGVDYSRMALYIPALQTFVSSVLIVATHTIVSLIDTGEDAAARSICAAWIVAVVSLHRPLQLGYARGANIMFVVMRPAAGAWLCASCWSTLFHSCTHGAPGATVAFPSYWWAAVFHAITLLLFALGCSICRPRLQQSCTLVGCLLLCVVAFIHPPSLPGLHGSCGADNVVGVLCSLLRTCGFVIVFSIFAYISAPRNMSGREAYACSSRCVLSGVWILLVWPPLLCLVVVQAAFMIWNFQAHLHPIVKGEEKAMCPLIQEGNSDVEATPSERDAPVYHKVASSPSSVPLVTKQRGGCCNIIASTHKELHRHASQQPSRATGEDQLFLQKAAIAAACMA